MTVSSEQKTQEGLIYDVDSFYAEWASLGLVRPSELSATEYRFVDPESVRDTSMDYYIDNSFHRSYAVLYVQRPVIARLHGGGDAIETMLRYDYHSGAIYQVDSFSASVGGFYFGNREYVYRVRHHHQGLTEAVESAQRDHAELIRHYLENTTRGSVDGVRIRDGAEVVDNDLIANNYERAVSVRERLLGRWAG